MGVFTSNKQAQTFINKLEFTPNLNFITSAHMQGSNKLATSGFYGVVSPNFKLFNGETDQEIDNMYVVDSSIFPTSIGANPMQSIYTIAKLFTDNILFHENVHSSMSKPK